MRFLHATRRYTNSLLVHRFILAQPPSCLGHQSVSDSYFEHAFPAFRMMHLLGYGSGLLRAKLPILRRVPVVHRFTAGHSAEERQTWYLLQLLMTLLLRKDRGHPLGRCSTRAAQLALAAAARLSAWDQGFPQPAMTLAAVDRLVHHSTIFEMNVESYRRRSAVRPGRAPDSRQAKRSAR